MSAFCHILPHSAEYILFLYITFPEDMTAKSGKHAQNTAFSEVFFNDPHHVRLPRQDSGALGLSRYYASQCGKSPHFWYSIILFFYFWVNEKNEANCYTFILQSLSALSFEYSPFSALISVILRLIAFTTSNLRIYFLLLLESASVSISSFVSVLTVFSRKSSVKAKNTLRSMPALEAFLYSSSTNLADGLQCPV